MAHAPVQRVPGVHPCTEGSQQADPGSGHGLTSPGAPRPLGGRGVRDAAGAA
jgi:hypothetical protein